MKINVMNEYIELTKKQITSYLKLVLENAYQKRYADMYIDTYINVRYYNFFDVGESLTRRKKILEELRKMQEYIIETNIKDTEIIEHLHLFFCYVLYIDNVVYCKDLKNKISKINKFRKRLLNIDNPEFENNLYIEIIKWQEEKEKLLELFDANEFFLKTTSYKDKLNIYKVNLKHQIKFPMEYSQLAIDKVFNMGLTNEDKLIIEYYLISVQIIRDILRQDFKTHYIVEFAETLLGKSKKIKSILNIIDNPVIQDKLSLKIRHEYYVENKEVIYELMREGFKFSIILDNSFEVNYKNMESLKMFKCVLLNKDAKQYDEIKQFNNEIINNIIEI